jgi:hypothetical protein
MTFKSWLCIKNCKWWRMDHWSPVTNYYFIVDVPHYTTFKFVFTINVRNVNHARCNIHWGDWTINISSNQFNFNLLKDQRQIPKSLEPSLDQVLLIADLDMLITTGKLQQLAWTSTRDQRGAISPLTKRLHGHQKILITILIHPHFIWMERTMH